MIAIACDHSALEMKRVVIELLEEMGLSFRDYGTDTADSCDYPIFAARAAGAVARGECERGILICGTGIGMSIAANKIRGVRCALCSEPYSARLTRMHNDSNVLALGARVIGPELARMTAQVWLETPFEGGRHQRRVDMLTALENREPLE
ncbi:MAG: ribose 5-phosphate isomerase B [Clostridiales bacterium]|nr:ribose 5-phosphate isomerase B [Clostridiales bacterium]